MHAQSSEENVMAADLISFLENIKFNSPRTGQTHSKLRPYQEELAAKYLENQELFVGVPRQIGTTHVIAGIAAWELLSKAGTMVAVDTDYTFNKAIECVDDHITQNSDVHITVTTKTTNQLVLSNKSILARLPTSPFKGYAVDVLLLEPSSSRIPDFDNWYVGIRPLLKPITGKLLIATLPVDKVKTLYKTWLADGKPRLMLDFVKCGHIERYGVDWYDEMREALSDSQFAVEYCGDFSILN